MSYRFIRLTDYYGQFLKSYYQNNPEVSDRSYQQEYEEITRHSVEIVSSYGNYMRKKGIDAIDIISNAYELQKKWARENDISLDLSEDQILLEQIKFYKPDIVWIDTTRLLNKDWIRFLRNEVSSIKLLVGHICAPYNSILEEAFRELDLVITCSPCTVEELKFKGVKNVELIYHAFNHTILNQIENDNTFPETNFIFTGSLLTGYGLHNTRIKYIEAIINSEIDMTIYGNLEDRSRVFLKKLLSKSIRTLNRMNLGGLVNSVGFLDQYKQHAQADIKYYSKRLVNSVRPPVFGLNMYKVLSKSNLCFNIHGDVAGKCGGNLRLFEATGVGTCLVTDWMENMKDLFELDTEIVTYRSEEECVEKVKWLMDNPSDMRKIAKAGQARTLKDHTIEKRVEVVDEMLKSRI